MKIKTIFLCLSAFLLFTSFEGCARVRTYTVVKDRVDQDLHGNQGYIGGATEGPKEIKNRRMTRKTYVTEVELGSAPVKKASGAKKEAVAVESVQEPANQTMIEEAAPAPKASESTQAQKITSYTVQPNDSLQKISSKVYGTSKKWKLIFDANADKLKSPDRIYAGQLLKIPQE
jgi:nucleoid-associated protein YgaU